MKSYVAVAIIAIVALCAASVSAAPLTEQQYQFLFTRFVDQYNKQYEASEFFTRYNVFKQNLNFVLAHNAKGDASYTVAINEFGDLTSKEFSAKMNKLQHVNRQFTRDFTAWNATPKPAVTADALDWRSRGAVTPIKNQGQCGSCWAFSSTGAIEGANFVKNGKLVSLSEQQLVDCSGSAGNEGCNGGLMDSAFQWVKQNGGICTESDYPYTARDGSCKRCTPAVQISGHVDVSPTEADLMNAVNIVPVAVAIEADQMGFQFYSGGVFDGACGTNLDHGVLAVGYGTDGSKPYWIVKNSWGTSWGEQGYIRMIRNKNQCGISNMASYVIGA